ncbi:cupin domain-containing protein [Agarivorans sp. QJM3NY_29]|uniref:cupin domain-containing protein n=1 Tax=unclassified Agarivorans TaxID=2636026 RepID=UPI003D7E00E2
MMDIQSINVELIPENSAKALYPEPFASMVKSRRKRKLGDYFGLMNFGVNLTTLAPHSISALKHHHSKQDEFIYIVCGTPTLIYGEKEILMSAGDCMGFKANTGIAHQLINRTAFEVSYLEVGDRTLDDAVAYPDDDLALIHEKDGSWSVLHKDGSAY